MKIAINIFAVNILCLSALAANDVRGRLIQMNLLPKIEQAKETFFRLDRIGSFWRQLIYDKDQMYGENAYDRGLHNNTEGEEGLLTNAKEASIFVATSGKFDEEFTIEDYIELHKIATKHRSRLNPMINNPRTGEIEKVLWSDYIETINDNLVSDSALTVETAKKNLEDLANVFAEKHQIIGYNISSEPRGQKQFVKIIFAHLNKEKLNNTASDIFNQFHQNILALQNTLIEANTITDDNQVKAKKKALKNYHSSVHHLVTNLFKELEFLHYFQDGNTRTNLMLANWLLSREGLNPVILYDPQLIIFLDHEQSEDYFREGHFIWLAEASNNDEAQERHNQQKK